MNILYGGKNSNNETIDYVLWECDKCKEERVLVRIVSWYDIGDGRTNSTRKIISGVHKNAKILCAVCYGQPSDYIDELETKLNCYNKVKDSLIEIEDSIKEIKKVSI